MNHHDRADRCLDCGKARNEPGVPAICATWHSPDRVEPLTIEEWRQRIVEHLGPQRMSLYMSKDIDHMAIGAVIAASLLAIPDRVDPRQPHGESGLFQHEPGALCVVCDRATQKEKTWDNNFGPNPNRRW